MCRLARLLVFFTLISFALAAQESKVDSLVAILKQTKDTKQQAHLLHKIVSSSWDFDFEKAKVFAEQEFELADKMNDPESKTIAFTDLGMYHYFVGDYKEAQLFFQKALSVAGDKNFGEFPAYTLTRIGNLYRVQGKFDSAQIYYKRTERLLRQVPPGIALASVYFHSGWMYQELSQYSRSLGYLYKARDIRYKIGDSLLIAECWRVIASSHLGLNQFDSAKYYLDKVESIAKRFGDTELVIFTSINKGDYLLAKGQTIEAIQAYEVALELLSGHDFKRYRALALFHVGKVFDSRSDFLKAIEYYLNALKINEQLNSRQEMARIYGWIGWAYCNLRNYVNAEEQAKRSLKMMKEINDPAGVAFAQNLLGQIALNKKEFNTAILYYDSALVLRKSLQLDLLASNTLYNIGKIYEKQGDYDKALLAYQEDLILTTRIGNRRIMTLSNNSIGLVYAYKKDFKNAEKYLLEGQRLALLGDQRVDRRDNYYNFAQFYKLSGKPQLAIEYYEKYIAVNDSLINRENTVAAMQRDALYQLDKKEREIAILNTQNEWKAVQIENQNARIRSQNIVIALIVLALILISIVTYVLYNYYRSKTHANLELSKLNREIHEQKEEIQAQSEELIEASQTIQEINKGLEKSVEERTQQLKLAYHELDTFIYRSSHDFRRPLTTFMGLAEVAKISIKDAAAIELFSKVNDTAHNLDRMLTKLQAVSQIASPELNLREISFNDELDWVLNLYRSAIVEKKIKIERKINVTRTFFSYPLIIRIILENLIENAIQFSLRANPFIQINIIQKGDELRIIIEDNGEGVAEEFHNRLFEMYFRANERSKGNGLGLYLVKKATEKLNGRIEFTSSVGMGSSFTIILPYFER